MYKEQITDKEAICLTAGFIMGSTLIIGVGNEAKNAAWLSSILGIVFAVPIILVYIRISSLYIGKDIFEIIFNVLGKYFGWFVSVLYIWYSFSLGSLIIRNFGEFVYTLTMPETPMIVIMLLLGLVCIVAVRLGIEVLSRTIAFLFPVVIFLLVYVNILAIPQFDYSNIKPIIPNDLTPIFKGAYATFSFPFAETILLLSTFFTLKEKKSVKKVFLYGLSVSGFIITALTFRNILMLGPMLDSLYYPSYKAVSRIQVGDFIQRIEVSVTFVFAVCAFTKTSVCLFASCKGISKLLNLRDYRSIAIQIGLLMVYCARVFFENALDMRRFAADIYPYYALPFQVILPLIIWIFAEVKNKKAKTAPSKTN